MPFAPLTEPPQAVLLDRDGTLVVDVPYNTDPERVQPIPGVRPALDRLRDAGVPIGIVSNQSGIGRGLITPSQLAAVTARIVRDLGPFDLVVTCAHHPADGCSCRKPAPGMILKACTMLGVLPAKTLMVGDTGADMEAAANAGAEGALIPTPATRPDEIERAPRVFHSLQELVALICGSSLKSSLNQGLVYDRSVPHGLFDDDDGRRAQPPSVTG